MKITRLHKIKNYRIFRDFAWPASGLPDFARFNVIYGWNGAGKTSLSNIFRHIERREPLTDGEIEVVFDQVRAAGPEFGTAVFPQVRVFNRDTVDRNIFESPNQQFPPVFFLGEDSVEKQKQVEGLKKALAAQVQDETRWSRKKTDATAAYDSFCAEEAKGIKNLLTVAGGGPYNNYNAANFKTAIQALADHPSLPERLTDVQRQQYLSTKDGKAMDKVAEPSLNFPDFADLTKRTQAMLDRSVVSSVIVELAENPAVASWVNSGLKLHSGDNASSKCRFCDQPVPEQRMRQLEAHFNDEFKRFQADIDVLLAEVVAAQSFAKEPRIPPKEALYKNLRPDYEKARSRMLQQATAAQQSLGILVRALQAKSEEPFKRLELMRFITSYVHTDDPVGGVERFFQIVFAGATAISAAVGQIAFGELAEIIKQHNKHTDGFDAEVKAARSALAQDELLKALPEWKKKLEAVNHAGEQAASAREQAKKLNLETAALEVEIRQHQRPAEELNREVAAYLGRDELRFEVEQSGYRICRGGQPAMHLSDGERTAIAFLYFLKSLEGTDFDLKNGVVVIDDPVSSLDANSLYSAFGFMKQRTVGAGQLFVLTHNFAFFRQVKNWFKHLRGQDRKQGRFYMLTTDFAEGRRTAKLEVLDPFLHDFESEYHYLFKRVHDEAHKAPVSGLESYYALPNIARRLLESFLAFRVPDKQGDLLQKLESIQYDQAKKTRIIRFLHTYSHFDQVAEPEHDLSVLSETPAVLQEVLSLIGECDPGHYNRMVELVGPSSIDEEEPETA